MTPFERTVLCAIESKRWRGEVALCLELGTRDQDPKVVDALFDLVRAGFAEWFGAEGKPDRPMRYRITTRGREELSIAREAGAA